ncbi:MAG: putative transposase [Gammaproteobacteria bacterium]|jgi:putative transposase
MARMARVVVPHFPHHVTQRGNRRQSTFFCPHDYQLYLELVSTFCRAHHVRAWAYCLMPNHVHLILVPEQASGLCDVFSEAHRRYTRHVNFRERWRGHLWQGRFFSCPMDEHHLLAAARYIELNPLRAGLCKHPGDWPWSSARAHLTGIDDALVDGAPLLKLVHDWAEFLREANDPELDEQIRKHARTGRPLGSDSFVHTLEELTGRRLRPRNPGPKPNGLRK